MSEPGDPVKAMSSGFFGCFGVLAAIITVIVVFVVIAMARSNGAPPAPPPPPASAATLSNAGYCVEGLDQARRNGSLPASAVLRFPWSISDVSTDGRLALACGIEDHPRRFTITVEVLCADDENPTCARLVSVAPAA